MPAGNTLGYSLNENLFFDNVLNFRFVKFDS